MAEKPHLEDGVDDGLWSNEEAEANPLNDAAEREVLFAALDSFR
jgi:hypothetical protein